MEFKITQIDPGGGHRTLEQYLKAWKKRLPAKVFYPAASDAINRTLLRSRTRAVRRIAAKMDVPQKVVRRRFFVTRARARAGAIGGSLTYYWSPFNAARLYVNDPTKELSTPQRLRLTAKAQHRFPGRFIQMGDGGNVVVMKRLGKSKYPTTGEHVRLKASTDVDLILNRYTRTFLIKRFHQQVQYRLDKLSKSV